ncbi:hypothetical protein HYPSUDRAFT_133348 [Hypholoma sublateritium FD-334 SS-4]|uniref:SET domain-containing protein n=1 Tax=Hypholoma sublateritium (strain FD-334 SS-4) TaxID=945553 RepID=A0A0D2MPW7_HYPSF|nr:hypothetical protein HYPSUDRAFT_133348 [Hypholoma sublateritium FD-334 SS-4]
MNNQPRQPAHWPQGLKYINSSCFHSSVIPSVRRHVQGSESSKTPGLSKKIQGPKVAIRAIANTAHPACGQFGLFAAQRIPPKTLIIEYIGEIHCDERPESDYDLSLYRFSDGLSIGIDATTVGNEARFVNDYRGIATKPNAAFSDEKDEGGTLRMIIRSGAQEIKKGEEILVSYGKSWWRARSET